MISQPVVWGVRRQRGLGRRTSLCLGLPERHFLLHEIQDLDPDEAAKAGDEKPVGDEDDPGGPGRAEDSAFCGKQASVAVDLGEMKVDDGLDVMLGRR